MESHFVPAGPIYLQIIVNKRDCGNPNLYPYVLSWIGFGPLKLKIVYIFVNLYFGLYVRFFPLIHGIFIYI